jgi:hypothetical protein
MWADDTLHVRVDAVGTNEHVARDLGAILKPRDYTASVLCGIGKPLARLDPDAPADRFVA